MPLNRLPDVLLSNQTLTGVSADYLDGITSSTFSQSLRANRNINGGGTVTFDINGNLYWSNRFIIISNGRGPHYALDGYFDAYCPTSGTINGFGSAATRSATGAGINLGQWDALYVITPIGGSYSSISYAVVSYLADFEVPHNWVLIAVRNGDDGFVYLPNGMVLEPGQSKTSAVTGNLKVGTSNTENYIVFRGTNGDQPGGFDHTFIGERIYGGAEQSELVLFKGNDNDTSSGPDRIRLIASNHVFDTYTAPVSGSFSTVTASASNATRMIIKENGHVGIGTITPNTIATSSSPAMLGIVSNAVGTAGLVIRAIASQTSNLQEWQNTFGGVVAKIDNNSIFNSLNAGSGADSYSSIIIGGRWIRNEQRSALTRFGVNTGEWHMASNPDNSVIAITDNQVGVFATETTLPTFIIKGVASQTADLQQWQNSAGTVLTRIDSSGQNIWTYSIRPQVTPSSGAFIQLDSNQVRVTQSTAGAVAFIVKGAASQTADLQQWQNSAGTTLSKIDASGYLSTSKINFTGGTSTVSALALSDGTLSFESTAGQLFSISNSLTGTIFSVNDVSGLPIIEATDLGIVKINELYGQTVFGSGTPTASALTTFVARTTSTIPVVVKGIASQSANLQNWYAGDGTLGTRIGPYGELIGHNQLANGIGGTLGLVMWSVISGSANYIPITVQGHASQTADLQRWQNSSGTVLAKIESTGIFSVNNIANSTLTTALIMENSGVGTGTGTQIVFRYGGANYASISSIYSGTPVGADMVFNVGSTGAAKMRIDNNGTVTINGFGAAAQGLIVKGAASQTANLQEWQDSAGNLLLAIRSDGVLRVSQIISKENYSSYFSFSSGSPIQVNPLTSGTVGLVVKAVTSQTANLQEWQNSSGTVIANITPAGKIAMKHINGINGDMLSLGSNGASDIFVVGYDSSSSITYINGGSYGPIQVQLNSAANGKFVIKGAASQTANLQEWQDSAGTVLARITSNGILATTVTTYSPFYQGLNGSGGVISIANSQPVTVTPQSASISVLVAKGAASQTADLQQWQNSSGAVLAKITASGSLELNGKDIELMNIMGAF